MSTPLRLGILLAALFAAVIAQVQMLFGLGQTPGEFAADSDATLKVAGWAFAIWGVIYLGLLAYALRQALPRTRISPLARRLAWPALLGLLGIGAWIVAAAKDWEWATVALIVGSAAILVAALLANSRAIRSLDRYEADRWWVVAPLALLAGWLTVAAPVNLITILTGNDQLPGALDPTTWALLAVAAVAALALFVAWRMAFTLYALPIAWGLFGVWAAEQARNPTLAWAAAIASGVILLGVAPMLIRRPQP